MFKFKVNDRVRPTAALLAKYPTAKPGIVVKLCPRHGVVHPELLWVDGFNCRFNCASVLLGSPAELWELDTLKFRFGQEVVLSEIGQTLFGWQVGTVKGFGATSDYFRIKVAGKPTVLWHERFWERSVIYAGDKVKVIGLPNSALTGRVGKILYGSLGTYSVGLFGESFCQVGRERLTLVRDDNV